MSRSRFCYSAIWPIAEHLGGFAGQTSFGHALFMAVGAYTSHGAAAEPACPWFTARRGLLSGASASSAISVFAMASREPISAS
jgi:ABC-type branched-subunit amino acid transport system permease subunit